MSDNGFLKRWSRRKRTETAPADPPPAETSRAEPPPSNLPPQAGEGLSSPPPRSGGGREGAAPQAEPLNLKEPDEIDPATLPPLESLGPDSDYTVFLKKGVPEALRIAALRKAWALDPFIRDFRSPAIDYGWDFTTPDYNLRATDNVAKMLDRIFPPKPERAPGETSTEEPAAAAPATPETAAPGSDLPKIEASQPAPEIQPRKPGPAPAPPRRKHGGALPD